MLFLSAARAAMCAGRRRKSVSERNAGARMRRSAKKIECKSNRGFVGIRQVSILDKRKMRKEVDKEPPFVAVRMNGRKRRVVSGSLMMAMMRSNKRYKPGD